MRDWAPPFRKPKTFPSVHTIFREPFSRNGSIAVSTSKPKLGKVLGEKIRDSPTFPELASGGHSTTAPNMALDMANHLPLLFC